jgi:hypothetical protein
MQYIISFLFSIFLFKNIFGITNSDKSIIKFFFSVRHWKMQFKIILNLFSQRLKIYYILF